MLSVRISRVSGGRLLAGYPDLQPALATSVQTWTETPRSKFIEPVKEKKARRSNRSVSKEEDRRGVGVKGEQDRLSNSYITADTQGKIHHPPGTSRQHIQHIGIISVCNAFCGKGCSSKAIKTETGKKKVVTLCIYKITQSSGRKIVGKSLSITP